MALSKMHELLSTGIDVGTTTQLPTRSGRRFLPESQRIALSNLHKHGTPAVKAGVHPVTLVELMLKEGKSGIDLKL